MKRGNEKTFYSETGREAWSFESISTTQGDNQVKWRGSGGEVVTNQPRWA
jgi:hypothetical protein